VFFVEGNSRQRCIRQQIHNFNKYVSFSQTDFRNCLQKQQKKKDNAIPVTGCGGPKGCEMLRLPHFLDSWLTDGIGAVILMHWLLFTPEDSW
jgi:hypothetical protein